MCNNSIIRIGFTGPDGVGKTTMATKVAYACSDAWCGYAHVASMADPVYAIASEIAGIDVSVLKENKGTKLRDMPYANWGNVEHMLDAHKSGVLDVTVRDLLRGIGNGMRESIHPDIWIQYMLKWTSEYPGGSVFFFDDIRYNNEVKHMDLVFRVCRDGIEYSYHASDSPVECARDVDADDIDLVVATIFDFVRSE